MTASVLVVGAPAAQARAQHCGMRIKHNFTLRRNLHNCRGDGLVVAANNITVNLAVTPSTAADRRSTAGVRVAGFHGVTVPGGVIRQFGKGIWLVRADDDRILNNRISGSFDEGIFTNETSDPHADPGNRISWSGTRIHAVDADGIDARGDGVRVIANTIRHSNDDGIDVNGSGVTIDGNNVVRQRATTGSTSTARTPGPEQRVERATATTGSASAGMRPRDHAATTSPRQRRPGHPAVAGTSIDGGGNRASRNGDTRQCVRVDCVP